MTVQVEVPEVIYAYTGPGDYDFDFETPDTTTLKIKHISENQLISDLVLGTDYTVAYSPGSQGGIASVTFDDPAGGPYTGELELYRETPIDQQTNLINNDPLDMDVLERAYDKLTMLLQEQGYQISSLSVIFHYRGVWAPGVTYFVNDIVQYPDVKGSWYAANMEHDSSTTPDQDAANWVLVLDTASVYQDVQRAELAAEAAEASEQITENWALLAEKWAQNPQNVEVVPGQYSAMHWAIIAQQNAGAGITWFEPYLYGPEYQPLTMVRDGAWTMLSNKITTERAAPQPSGSSFYIFDGTLAPQSATAKQIIFGTRLVADQNGYMLGYRIETAIGNEYKIYLIEDPLGTPIITSIINFTADVDGWVEFAIANVLISAGATIDLMAVVNEPDPTPTTWTAPWEYVTPQNSAIPAAGTIVHPRGAPGLMAVDKNDDNGTDRSTELAALTVGDVISVGATSWSIQSTTDDGTYMTFGVSPPSTHGATGILSFTFETVTATPIPYGRDDGYWVGSANRGMFIADGQYEDIVPSDNAYGMDLKVQASVQSEDWDVVAQSADIGSSTAAYVEEAPEDGTPYARQDKAWVSVQPDGRYGVVPIIGVHTPNRVDTALPPLYFVTDGGDMTIQSASNSGFAVGDVISFMQGDANDVQIVPDVGVNRWLPDLKQQYIRGQDSIVSIIYTSDTDFRVYGDLRDA